MRPMLAATIESEEDLAKLNFPVYVQPKLDGRRCLIIKGKAYSRSLKPLPNRFVRDALTSIFKDNPNTFDGEIISGNNLFDTQSAIATYDGTPKWEYHIFDTFDSPTVNYERRREYLIYFTMTNRNLNIHGIPSCRCFIVDQILFYEDTMLHRGYEGIIIRSPTGPYKFGRSTLAEGYLLKFKRYKTTEGVIVNIYEAFENTNPQEVNELGLSYRSHAEDGMVAKNMMGSIIVSHPTLGMVTIGTGFTELLRRKMWLRQQDYLGKTVTFKYRDYGIKDKPREVSFLAFRDKDDL